MLVVDVEGSGIVSKFLPRSGGGIEKRAGCMGRLQDNDGDWNHHDVHRC